MLVFLLFSIQISTSFTMNETYKLDDLSSKSCSVSVIITYNQEVATHLLSSINRMPIFPNTPLHHILHFAESKRHKAYTDLVCITASVGARFSILESDDIYFSTLDDLSFKEIRGNKYHYDIFFAYRRPYLERTIQESKYEILKFVSWLCKGNTDLSKYSADNQNETYCYHFFKPVK
jgi:hypothetical protein